MSKKEWYGAKMSKENAAKFKVYLREKGIYFEPSEDLALIHVSILMDEEEAKEINKWIHSEILN